jgi:LuxR family quorum-sensing system transcriptional regulator SolR
MRANCEALHEDFHRAPDERKLFQLLADSARQLGFEYCSYGIRAPLPASRPKVKIFDSYPPGWMNHYQERNFLAIDPTVALAARSTDLVLWSDATFASTPHLWTDAQDAGLGVGAAQAAWGMHGMLGLVSFARSTDPISANERLEIDHKIFVVTNIFHALMCPFMVPSLLPDIDVALTAREREVLLWTGEGKTAYVIGHLLGISERTVNFHVNNLLRKLNAANKIQAFVKAHALGLLDL